VRNIKDERVSLNVLGKSGYDGIGQSPRAGRHTEIRTSGGVSCVRRFTTLTLLVGLMACQRGLADVESTPPEVNMTTAAATAADSDASTANATPLPDLRPAVRWYMKGYSPDAAPLIVQCMNDLGWEATYDPRFGAFLPELPLPQGMERDGAMGLCVASSHAHRSVYID
jgi:hypothetical protein